MEHVIHVGLWLVVAVQSVAVVGLIRYAIDARGCRRRR